MGDTPQEKQSEYNRTYYKKKRGAISEARKKRYQTDPEYRERMKRTALMRKRKLAEEIKPQLLLEAILQRLATEIRGGDVAALIEENKLIALLPMTPKKRAELALDRHIKLLNSVSVEMEGVPLAVKVAGVATGFDPERTPDANAFFRALSDDLAELRETLRKKRGDSTATDKNQ